MANKKIAVISEASGFVDLHIRKHFSNIGWETLSTGRNASNHICFNLEKPIAFSNITLNIQADVFIHLAAAHEVTCQGKSVQCSFI